LEQTKLIKAVIFDIDGTLVDSVDLHAKAWQEAFAQFGVAVTFQQARDQIGKGGDELLPTFLTELQIKHFGEKLKAWRGEHFKKNYIHKVKPFPESHALLRHVKESGKRLAAGSSAKEEELEYYLKLLKAEHLFDVKTCADDAERSKPNPDIFQAALSKLGLGPHYAIVVGDSPYDIEAAKKAKIPGIGVLSGGFPREWLIEAGAVAIYGGPEDLLSHYETSPIETGTKAIA
jgi:HAD superfamily hydrolase (TIGR01509 family)